MLPRCGERVIVAATTLSRSLPLEGHRVAVEALQPVVADGDAMGVAAQIVENLPGATERRFCIDDPVGLRSGLQPCGEGLGVIELVRLTPPCL